MFMSMANVAACDVIIKSYFLCTVSAVYHHQVLFPLYSQCCVSSSSLISFVQSVLCIIIKSYFLCTVSAVCYHQVLFPLYSQCCVLSSSLISFVQSVLCMISKLCIVMLQAHAHGKEG